MVLISGDRVRVANKVGKDEGVERNELRKKMGILEEIEPNRHLIGKRLTT